MEAEKKAEALSIKLNCKVLPIVFHDQETGEDIIGFIKEMRTTCYIIHRCHWVWL